MRFLLFNLAVIGALFYLFSADRSGSDIGNDFREDPLQVIRQELESLARDVAEGRIGEVAFPAEHHRRSRRSVVDLPDGEAFVARVARSREVDPGGLHPP